MTERISLPVAPLELLTRKVRETANEKSKITKEERDFNKNFIKRSNGDLTPTHCQDRGGNLLLSNVKT